MIGAYSAFRMADLARSLAPDTAPKANIHFQIAGFSLLTIKHSEIQDELVLTDTQGSLQAKCRLTFSTEKKLEVDPEVGGKNQQGELIEELLWVGIREYIQQIHPAVTVSWTNIPTRDSFKVALVLWYLQKGGFWEDTEKTAPLPDVEKYLHLLNRRGDANAFKQGRNFIKGMFAQYLKSGAKVCRGPAYSLQTRGSRFLLNLNSAVN